jgi:hypothetical protein
MQAQRHNSVLEVRQTIRQKEGFQFSGVFSFSIVVLAKTKSDHVIEQIFVR